MCHTFRKQEARQCIVHSLELRREVASSLRGAGTLEKRAAQAVPARGAREPCVRSERQASHVQMRLLEQ